MDEQSKTHGAFSWCELMTTDSNSAKDFYTKLFGWTTEEMGVTPGMIYTVIKVGGKGIGGILSAQASARGPARHPSSFQVCGFRLPREVTLRSCAIAQLRNITLMHRRCFLQRIQSIPRAESRPLTNSTRTLSLTQRHHRAARGVD